MPTPKFEVKLWELTTAALLISAPTNVTHTNQVGGISCQQLSLEDSLLVPIDSDSFLQDGFRQIFLGPPWNGACETGIDAATAAKMDALLAQRAAFVKVDRARLLEGVEAWIYVKVDLQASGLISDKDVVSAVLTWENSD